jgi:hypothetical protein
MAMANVVVEGSNVSASQLKDFFRKIEDGSINRQELQAFLEGRNPFNLGLLRAYTIESFKKQVPELDWEGWTIDEKDLKALELRYLDPSMIKLVNGLDSSEEIVRRLRSSQSIMLGAETSLALLDNQRLIPTNSWVKNLGSTVFFPGTILRSPEGEKFISALHHVRRLDYWKLGRRSLNGWFADWMIATIF